MVTDVLTIGSMYLILICAFASGIIFVLGTEEMTSNISNYALLVVHNTSAASTTTAPRLIPPSSADVIAHYSG